MRTFPLISAAVLFFLYASLTGCQSGNLKSPGIKVLILSGSNNHDWEKTGALLQKLFQDHPAFQSRLTERPDTLTSPSLEQFDVVVSNWNSWPENDLRWPEATEDALLEFISQGGGLVTFHASSSAFYQWEGFREITTASWEEGTYHGKMSPVRVIIDSRDHPVSRGLSDFHIYDELWMNARSNEKFTPLAYAYLADQEEGIAEKQAAVMVSEHGEGRIFHTILGHDDRTMRNSGFESLLIRGTEWAATGQVKQAITPDMQISPDARQNSYHWIESDSTLALYNHRDVVWQYNFNNRFGKPYFHPVYVGRTRMTCLSPDDHRWHLGQWFSWKFINGINYWEYVGESYRAAGLTRITDISFSRDSDFSARIELDLEYLPHGGVPLLKEKRSILVSPPDQGSLTMEYRSETMALSDSVVLDRTPIPGEEGGKPWGGYAGLSLRFNQDFMNAAWIFPGNQEPVSGSKEEWCYMGFTGLRGEQAGSAMFISDQTHQPGEGWYLTSDAAIPFYYLSPSVLYQSPITLRKGEELHLNYQIRHLIGEQSKETLEKQYQEFIHP